MAALSIGVIIKFLIWYFQELVEIPDQFSRTLTKRCVLLPDGNQGLVSPIDNDLDHWMLPFAPLYMENREQPMKVIGPLPDTMWMRFFEFGHVDLNFFKPIAGEEKCAILVNE